MRPPASASENRTRGAKKIGPGQYLDFFNRIGQQPTSGRSSRVGVTQISWLPILIDASADRHFDRDMAW